MDQFKGLLSGLRVIDCGTYIAGPAAAVILSDFGAEVIKIERPPFGDPHRYLHLVPGMPVSAVPYCWILDGRNKKSLALDLGVEAGRQALLKLVSSADVFITNYQPALVRKFALSYDDLGAINHRLIYAHITGYGDAGGEVDKSGYDLTAYWARSGLMGAMHNADAEPALSVAGFGDHPTAMTLFAAILLGLYRRQATGQGCRVSTSLMANGAWSNACGIQAALCDAAFLPKWTRLTSINPAVNHYLTRDGQRFITCCLDPKKDWPNLCRALGRPELIDDSRFQTPEARRANAPDLVTIIDQAVAARDMSEWIDIFRQHDVIWGPVPATQQVPADAQMESNGVFLQISGGPRTIDSPIRVDGFAKTEPSLAPAVGQHSVEILQSLGYSEDSIQELIQRGITMA
ncbi:MAG: CaiB/BaiF CoA transferase family protein [Bryobacteraceae bacterium]